eukprot:18387_1
MIPPLILLISCFMSLMNAVIDAKFEVKPGLILDGATTINVSGNMAKVEGIYEWNRDDSSVDPLQRVYRQEGFGGEYMEVTLQLGSEPKCALYDGISTTPVASADLLYTPEYVPEDWYIASPEPEKKEIFVWGFETALDGTYVLQAFYAKLNRMRFYNEAADKYLVLNLSKNKIVFRDSRSKGFKELTECDFSKAPGANALERVKKCEKTGAFTGFPKATILFVVI